MTDVGERVRLRSALEKAILIGDGLNDECDRLTAELDEARGMLQQADSYLSLWRHRSPQFAYGNNASLARDVELLFGRIRTWLKVSR